MYKYRLICNSHTVDEVATVAELCTLAWDLWGAPLWEETSAGGMFWVEVPQFVPGWGAVVVTVERI